jgi:hypothetical protein
MHARTHPTAYQGWSKQAYLKALGYRLVDEERFESAQHFTERMRGYLSLWAAITQTTAIANTYGLAEAWGWMARLLNLGAEPHPLTGMLVLTVLEVAGAEMQRMYGRQFGKMLDVLVHEVLPRLPKEEMASKVRLELFLQEHWLPHQRIPPHAGKALTK